MELFLNGRARSIATVFGAALLVSACGGGGGEDDDVAATPPSSDPRTPLTVNKATDDGSEGTLRWAIQRSNASPGTYRIALTAPAGGLLIKPSSELPALVGPALIEGPWKGEGSPTVAIDGALLYDTNVLDASGNPTACPGQTAGVGANVRSLKNPGLSVVDSGSVKMSGFEVRNFCTGVMLLRSKDSVIRYLRFVNNRGAAGLLVTGDVGDQAGTFVAGSASNNVIEYNDFLNNSDSMDVVRGADNTLIQFNKFVMDANGIVPSQAIEFLSSNNNKVYDNVAIGFAEALQLRGNNHDVARNTMRGNSIALTMSGTGNKVYDNVVQSNRLGLSISGGATTLSRNKIWDQGKDISLCNAGGICNTNANWLNARLGISVRGSSGHTPNDLASACADGFADCDAYQNYPELKASVWQAGGFQINGSLVSRPNTDFVIEFFASHKPGAVDSFGEGEVIVGKLDARTDAAGTLNFSQPTGVTDPLKDGTKTVYFTATATRVATGQTSEFSQAIAVNGP